MSEQERAPAQPARTPWTVFYEGVLGGLEKAVLALLLGTTIAVSFTEILNRNFGWRLWDSAAANKLVYAFTFYLGLFGAVVATRQLKHIRIDAVAPYLGERGRRGLEFFSAAVGCVASAWLAATAYRYLAEFVPVDERFLPDKVEWYWQLRWWRWPIAIAFGWMATHFAVHVVRLAAELGRGGEPRHGGGAP